MAVTATVEASTSTRANPVEPWSHSAEEVVARRELAPITPMTEVGVLLMADSLQRAVADSARGEAGKSDYCRMGYEEPQAHKVIRTANAARAEDMGLILGEVFGQKALVAKLNEGGSVDESDLAPLPATTEEGVRAIGKKYRKAFREYIESDRTTRTCLANEMDAPDGASDKAKQSRDRAGELAAILKLLGQAGFVDAIHEATVAEVYRSQE